MVYDYNIRTILVDMPETVRGYTVESDGFYTIVLNGKLNHELNEKSYKHEIDHIQQDDFIKNCEADLIESISHKRSS